MEHALGHHGVGVDAFEGLETLLLNLTGFYHSFANCCRRLAGLHLRELGEGHGLYLTVDVDTVE
jgi:hypothetical protein